MGKRVVLTGAVLVGLLLGLPAEGRQVAGRADPVRLSPFARAGQPARGPQAASGRTGGDFVAPRSVPRSYVPPLVDEVGRVRVSLVGLLHTGKQDPGWRFSGQSLRDLLIVVEYRDLPAGSHTQRLKLYAPDGALYQQFTTAFEATGQPAQGKGQSRRGAGWERVETRLLVGGTWITEHSLYGPWRFELYMDQAQVPTTKDQSFHLAK